MISSIKVNGRKLYEYARSNTPVERPLRDVEIYETEVLDEAAYQFKAACSSGTYIRSLCRDLALKSGNVGCLSSLVRTRVGRFTLEQCATLEAIEQGDFQLFSLNDALAHFPQIQTTDRTAVCNGKKIKVDCDAEKIVIVDQQEVLAIYEKEREHVYRCARGLW